MKTKLLLLLTGAFIVGCSSMNPSDWNRTQKGAAIGGTSGAVLGGIIGNQTGDTGTGAIIGGAAGAGAGGLIGHELDRQDDDDDYRRGRYDSDYDRRRHDDYYRNY